MQKLKPALRFSLLSVAGAMCALVLGTQAFAEGPAGSSTDPVAKFRQLRTELPTPNIYRNAAGAPGPAYWQQQANYKIEAVLDEDQRRISAKSTINYINNSPDPLNYIWLSLDQNRFKDGSLSRESATAAATGTSRGDGSAKQDRVTFSSLRYSQANEDREFGFEFKAVTDKNGNDLSYTINGAMMRIDLNQPLQPEERTVVKINWDHNIIDVVSVGGRGGYEYSKKDGNYIFGLAQWFPRLAAYTDYTGWQNKQFLGRGEFTLEFGDYDVSLTVPSDHIVAATGVLQNPNEVLSGTQRRRLANISTDKPSYIVTPEEAKQNEKTKAKGSKTWKFKAENVRDFAWSSSRKYIWDAMLFEQDDDQNPTVTAMSFFPNEADPIWSHYSTEAVVHTMDVYNKFAFNYPYPVAQSVNTWERGGMEYPMITFNGYRPTADEKSGEVTYSRRVKDGLVGVIIHEIGHIYFPMTVNSDERRWTWMDEGINTFLEYQAEYQWEENFPISRYGSNNPMDDISRYMTSSNQVPIMTQSDSVLQFGPNAYSKPATALIVLRETVMGRELFDFAFREYANRWKFKRPTPADFFRTMEDASAVDLDWFWRGWFFGTDHVDVALTDVRQYQISSQDPDVENDIQRDEFNKNTPETIVQRRNREEGIKTRVSRNKALEDFYSENDRFTVTNKDRNSFQSFLKGLKDWEKDVYERALEDNNYYYFVDFKNIGGLITPLPLTLTYEDGDTEDLMIPAEIWRRSPENVTKLIVRVRKIVSIDLDTQHQTADSNYSNNSFPQKVVQSQIEMYKSNYKASSMMADMLVELKDHKGELKSEDDNGKAVPMQSGENGNFTGNQDTMDEATPKKDRTEKQKSTLRKTLEKMLGGE